MFEVLLGHGNCTINGEASVNIPKEVYTDIIKNNRQKSYQ